MYACSFFHSCWFLDYIRVDVIRGYVADTLYVCGLVCTHIDLAIHVNVINLQVCSTLRSFDYI